MVASASMLSLVLLSLICAQSIEAASMPLMVSKYFYMKFHFHTYSTVIVTKSIQEMYHNNNSTYMIKYIRIFSDLFVQGWFGIPGVRMRRSAPWQHDDR